jgi:hypothetical protein
LIDIKNYREKEKGKIGNDEKEKKRKEERN